MKDLIIGFIFAGVISLLAYKKKSLSLSGALAALFMGSFMYFFGGLVASAAMVAFFLSSSILSHLFKGRKKEAGKLQEKGSRRDCFQVFANGGIGLIFAALFYFTKNPLFLIGCGVAFGESNADTWASEVGVLSKRKPVSIINGKPLERGVSGGVSPLGTLAAFLGSSFIGLVFAVMFYMVYGHNKAIIQGFWLITLLGFLGCLIDSLLGATVQAQYYCEAEDAITEKSTHRGNKNKLIKGVAIFNNDLINLSSNLLSTLLVFLFSIS